ncbi:hypothetical protein AX15_004228 [Amanita polypyramis BW_CC]|nr:hypothetical protein AX15_004228 [Amanita polypyramis BW_CC]
MPVNRVAENVFGTTGTICWAIQLIPQIYKSWRERSTKGLSHWLVLIWGLSGALLGTYAVTEKLNIPLMIQPQLFAFLSLTSWGQCMYYDKGHSKLGATLLTLAAMTTTGAFEVAMVYAVRPSYEKGNRAGTLFFGTMAAVFVALGLLPQYWEIYKHREVIGISITFMLVDMLGGVFSDLSLAFKPKFDVAAAVTYTLVIVMDGAIVLAALLLNPRAARRRNRQAQDLSLEENDDTKSEASSLQITSPSETEKRDGNIGTTQLVIGRAE